MTTQVFLRKIIYIILEYYKNTFDKDIILLKFLNKNVE